MKENDQPPVGEARTAEIIWNSGGLCRGSVQVLPDGRFHFVLQGGQSLDGCPAEGAILRVAGFFNSTDRYKILRLERSTFTNARNFRAEKLPELEEASE